MHPVRTLLWIIIASAGAAIIAVFVARMFDMDELSMVIGGAIGGAIGGYIAMKQQDRRQDKSG